MKDIAEGEIVGGVDEAGRGCVLGPLVVAGVSADADALREFGRLGVKDSKKLTHKKRCALYDEIVDRAEAVHTAHIDPPDIDVYVKYGVKYRKLNFLEAMHMARVIEKLGASRVFVDAPDTNPHRFTRELSEMIAPCPTIVAEHKADSTYVVVSAASIVAKVQRDRAVEDLRREHGDFGSGYPSDPQTIDFLTEYVKREGIRPPFSRKSWRTWERIVVARLDL